ncbi:hypothetical protein FHS44_000303 [Streptosporangium saharense]|uniref:Uncharacterized protein n=1 Tax=Streptosporangium saharense TaxID=1706840 RepID=A0A7W7VK28_9ACTN|nr:hypothetical protein [Streptosporangium saharense]
MSPAGKRGLSRKDKSGRVGLDPRPMQDWVALPMGDKLGRVGLGRAAG